MKKQAPQATTLLECPASKKNCEVSFEVNIFRGVNQGGLEVKACSEFLYNKNGVTCGQDCIDTPEAQVLHEQEIRKHQEELSKIGSNVLV